MYLRSLLEDWSCIMPLESAKKWSKPQIEAAAPPVLHCRRLLQTVSQTHCRGRWNEKKGDLQLEAALEVIWGVERWFFSIFCSCTHVSLDFWVHHSFLLRECRKGYGICFDQTFLALSLSEINTCYFNVCWPRWDRYRSTTSTGLQRPKVFASTLFGFGKL